MPFLLAALTAAGCGAGPRTSGGPELARGKELFGQKCGSCHVLRDAGTRGTIGPDLDAAFGAVREQGFAESTIRRVVRGQIANPLEETGTGQPGMPANLVTGADADAVAAYVTAVAGVADGATAGDTGASGGSDGRG